MDLDLECRHFSGDRPCGYHKRDGMTCDDCPHREERGERILVVKLDAVGDVLRTTSILPAVRRESPRSWVVWLTSPAAKPVLDNNPLIEEIWTLGPEAIARLGVERFDRILNPDASRKSAALASLARGGERRGYVLDEKGVVRPAGPEAEEWLEMGGRDDRKRANRRTYQEHVHRLLRLDPEGQRILLRLTDRERAAAAGRLERGGIGPSERIVGFNTGSSARWPLKRWPKERFLDLARRFDDRGDIRVLLLGGELEAETNRWIAARSGGAAIDVGSDHSMRNFFALLERCEAVVTGDTLALHASLALGRATVALFGPTSPWEIDMYGLGVRVTADLDCLCCYRGACDRSPNCMESIDVETVRRALEGLLGSEAAEAPAEAAQEPEGETHGIHR
ncbi:MAG: glycosyltransferase family 9 protein [Candidatus Eisenbacteria bacterium]|nr:glycosyltransferase family 9 protein [Candidatus Eisenbacteria bacterium]